MSNPRIKITVGQEMWGTLVEVNGQVLPVTRMHLDWDARQRRPRLILECDGAQMEPLIIEGELIPDDPTGAASALAQTRQLAQELRYPASAHLDAGGAGE